MKKKIFAGALIVLGIFSSAGSVISRWSEEIPLIPPRQPILKVDDYPVKAGAAFPAERPLKGWHVTGKYLTNKTAFDADRRSLENFETRGEDPLLWELWANNRDWFGKLSTPAFKAPVLMSMRVAGFPHLSGNQLYLERLDTRERLALEVSPPPLESWVNFRWLLPPSWRGIWVHVVAEGGATQPASVHSRWLGISVPMEPNKWDVLHSQVRPVLFILVYFFQFCLLFIPAVFLAILLVQKCRLPDALTMGLSLTISSLAGYGIFWVYLLDHQPGRVISAAWMAAGAGSLYYVARYKKAIWHQLFADDVRIPAVVMFLVGGFYLALLYHPGDAATAEILPRIRFTHALPTDNILQKIFAEKLYLGIDVSPFYGDWKSSDRPPLQAGMVLSQRPLMQLLSVGEHYQILSLILQCAWVPAIWALCRSLGASLRTIGLVMSFAVFSGFFLVNSIYVWPKLYGGSQVVFAISLILPKIIRREKLSLVEMVIFASASATGMLAHGGVSFTLLALALLLATPRYFPGIGQIMIGIACFLSIYSTWMAYQHFYDPPGNALLKLHFAGSAGIDDESSLASIKNAYGKISLTQWLDLKQENFKSLLETGPLVQGFSKKGNSTDWLRSEFTENWHKNQFFHIIPTLGLLNLGWFLFLFAVFRQNKLYAESISWILKICFLSFLLWILLLFGPPVTNIVIHHGSYANIILLFTALSLLVSRLPCWISAPLLLCHLGIFVFLWGGASPERFESMDGLGNLPNFPMIVASFFFGAMLLRFLFKFSRSP
ncbi:MAG: hypothetical protein HQM13_09850 [SAR324 cluster bacterium]|nr:hypothetical protein [SAR324 cluster bacterium]